MEAVDLHFVVNSHLLYFLCIFSDESAQEVPDVGYISDDDADDEEEDDEEDDDDYVLHEMQAIEREIDDIEEQMIQP